MQQALDEIVVQTDEQGFTEITEPVQAWVTQQSLTDGLLTVYLRHTSASLVIQENIDPDVQADMLDYFRNAVPEDLSHYRHTAEGADDQPAHIRAALTQTHLAIPMRDGRLTLGRYQGIFLFEHRHSGRPRHLALHLLGT
jgi:secondary thiamine-phosphate synthase enzyme